MSEGTNAWSFQRRGMSGMPATVEALLAGETGADDIVDPRLFEAMRAEPVTEYVCDAWSFPPLRFPMPYTRASFMQAVFTVPVDQVLALLPATPRLKPVRLSPGRALISFFGAAFHRSALGPYNEFGMGVPVIVDRSSPPLFPAVLQGHYPGFGVYIVELPVDHERACRCGVHVCGYPKIVADVRLEDRSGATTVRVTDAGAELAAFTVERPGSIRERTHRQHVSTVSLHEGEVLRTDYQTVGMGWRKRRGSVARVEFGTHPRWVRYRDLDLSARPLETAVFRRFNWYIREPVSLGPARDHANHERST